MRKTDEILRYFFPLSLLVYTIIMAGVKKLGVFVCVSVCECVCICVYVCLSVDPSIGFPGPTVGMFTKQA